MAAVTFIIGESGTGKSRSLKSLDPKNTLLIQAIPKPLPFQTGEWKRLNKDNPTGNVLVSDNAQQIVKWLSQTKRDIIVIDDLQFVMANEFMRRSGEVGFQKFNELARNLFDIMQACVNLPENKRVYLLSHSEVDEDGRIRAKTLGKMINNVLTLEALVTIVLRTEVVNGNYQFRTQNNGHDTVKSPEGLFSGESVDNDLSAVDAAIKAYYQIT